MTNFRINMQKTDLVLNYVRTTFPGQTVLVIDTTAARTEDISKVTDALLAVTALRLHEDDLTRHRMSIQFLSCRTNTGYKVLQELEYRECSSVSAYLIENNQIVCEV